MTLATELHWKQASTPSWYSFPVSQKSNITQSLFSWELQQTLPPRQWWKCWLWKVKFTKISRKLIYTFSSGSSGRVVEEGGWMGDGKIHEIYVAALGDHLFTARNEVGASLCFYMCLWFCSQGGGLPNCMLGYTDPPGPEAGTPPPPRADPPGADTPQEQIPPGSRPPWDQAPPSAVHVGRYGQQAGGMHPTGMQSCLWLIFT